MEQKYFYILTFGCQMNERDSETLAGMLEERGYTRTEERSEADVLLINTCSVRENADKKFFGTLGLIKKLKENKPSLVVGVCGCMMQQQHIIDTIKSKYSWVDIVFGTHNLHRLPQLLDNLITEKKKQREVWPEHHGIEEGLPAHRQNTFKAFVNIMYGCNNFCTYCIVPYTRGRERSRMPQEILKEVQGLVATGVKEITLLGQNVNSYRPDSAEVPDFPALLRLLNGVEGLQRIRFMTSHPKDLSEGLIEAYRDCEKLCPHIHLPVQSGSSVVLKRMNRRYTKEQYIDLVARLRKAVPNIAISTDIIVGFPGETEEDFLETLDLVNKVQYDSAFTFLYSVRKGTPAAEYEDQVPEETKHERFDRLVEAVNTISAEKNRRKVGLTEWVLSEGESKTDAGLFTGRTPDHKLINFLPGDLDPADMTAGKLVQVEVTSSNTFSLVGKAVSL